MQQVLITEAASVEVLLVRRWSLLNLLIWFFQWPQRNEDSKTKVTETEYSHESDRHNTNDARCTSMFFKTVRCSNQTDCQRGCDIFSAVVFKLCIL